jgi:hypothetical protein
MQHDVHLSVECPVQWDLAHPFSDRIKYWGLVALGDTDIHRQPGANADPDRHKDANDHADANPDTHPDEHTDPLPHTDGSHTYADPHADPHPDPYPDADGYA